ncbi:hypothetical protein NDU88_004028 [Pleurodeles waltl]|uniref:Uncharacterized protein n=1 Tax=Pleurodeles waltl TaxID=8319 RepID=A0AAV7M6D4_PLEWA|nr:hypothetical protein NDU88_004028 [Pleurodeles waltl]
MGSRKRQGHDDHLGPAGEPEATASKRHGIKDTPIVGNISIAISWSASQCLSPYVALRLALDVGNHIMGRLKLTGSSTQTSRDGYGSSAVVPLNASKEKLVTILEAIRITSTFLGPKIDAIALEVGLLPDGQKTINREAEKAVQETQPQTSDHQQ